MTAEVVGSASVQIDADFSNFDEQVRAKLLVAAKRAGDAAERTLKRSGRDSGKGFGDELRKTANKSASKSGKDAGNFFSRAFETAAAKSIGRGLFAAFAASTAALISSATPLSSVLGGAAAAVVALAGALGEASGAALSLGGVLGSLGLAAVAAKIGSQGLGDAWKAQTKALEELNTEGKVSEATQKKLDAALKNLAPNARSVVTTLAAMEPAWKKVRLAIQDNLFKNVGTTIQQLGARFLPILQTQLGGAAARLNATAVAFGRFLSSAKTSAQINGILTGLNRILGTLLPIVQPLAASFLNLFSASLPFAQQLANVIQSLGTRFAAFINTAVSSGSFQQFLAGAMQTAGTLFQLLGNVGRILGSIFSAGAATGGNLLTVLRDLTGQLAVFLQSAEGQAALASFFGLVSTAGQVLVGIFRTLQPLLGGIQALFSSLQGPLRTLGTALLPVVSQLAATLGATFRQLGPVLGRLVTALAPLVASLGGTLVAALTTLLPVVVQLVSAFAQIAPSLTPIVALLGETLVAGLQALTPVITSLIPVLTQFIQQFAAGLLPVLQTIAPVIPQLATSLAALLVQFVQLLPSLLPLLPPLAQLSVAMAQMVVAATPLITTILGALTSLLASLAPTISALIGPMTSVINGTIRIVNVFTTLISAGVRLASSITSSVGRMATNFINATTRIVSAVVSFGSRIVSAVTGAMASFASVIQSGVNKAVSFFTGLGSQILAAISGLAGQLAAAGAEAINGLVGGLTSGLSKVRDVAGQIAGAVTGPVGKLLKIASPSKVMKSMGKDTIQGFINGILEKAPLVRAALTNLARAIPSQVESAVAKVNSAVSSLGKGISSQQRTQLNTIIANARVGLQTIKTAQASVNKQLEAARSRLSELINAQRQFQQQIAQNIVQTGNITQSQAGGFQGIVDRLKSAVSSAQQFRTVLDRLARAGLNKTLLQQIAEAGPDAGLATARQLLAAGQAGIAQVNQLQSQLQSAANQAAKTAADALFAQGIKVAQGIVDGLIERRATLDAEMVRLGTLIAQRVISVLRTIKVGGKTLSIPGFAHGGIVSRDSLIRAGEGGRREAIVPLERPRDRDRVMRQSGLDRVTSDRGGKTRVLEVPVTVNGNLVSRAELEAALDSVLTSRGYPKVRGIQTAGGVL